MSSQQTREEYGAFGRFVERIGIPRPLFWGFVAVFIFMIGDGVEISRLPGYLAGPGGLNGAQASLTTGTVYGLAVLVASWLSGTLSAIWGPQRVMQLGAAIWVVFEILFLVVALPSQSLFLVALMYGIRGLAYPLFAFGFLVWVQTVTRVELRGSAAGWFWFWFAPLCEACWELSALLFESSPPVTSPIGQKSTASSTTRSTAPAPASRRRRMAGSLAGARLGRVRTAAGSWRRERRSPSGMAGIEPFS